MKNGKSSGRPNKKSKRTGRTQSSHDAPALFLPISFFAALSAWMSLSAPGRFGSGYPQISRRKQIIRTHLLSEKGSDYMVVVRPRGLEPLPVARMEPKSIVYTNFTTGAYRWRHIGNICYTPQQHLSYRREEKKSIKG